MELQQYLRLFRARWVAMVVITLLGSLAGYAWAATQPQVFTATGTAIVTTGTSSDLESALTGDNYAQSRVQSYLSVARSRTVAESAAEELGLDVSPDALVGRVGVSNPPGTAVLSVSADGATPEQARDLVEAWIAGMAELVDGLENSGGTQDGASVVALATLDTAVLPTAPSSPNTQFAVALGLVVGLTLAIAYALVRGLLDRRLRQLSDVEREFSLPALGAMPYDAALTRRGSRLQSLDFLTNEAVRQLRTNLQFMDVDHPPRVVVVTSPNAGDGKSTTAIKLAEALAESGRRVILIDADLRRPSIVDKLGLVDGAGLTDVLVGRVAAVEVLQGYGPTGNLDVLGSGPIPPNPSELLVSDAMHELLYSFPEDVTVLIDSPPLLPVTDAAALTARTDGALVVARSGRTTSDTLDRALLTLHKAHGRALGVILTMVPRPKGRRRGSYGYARPYEASRRSRREARGSREDEDLTDPPPTADGAADRTAQDQATEVAVADGVPADEGVVESADAGGGATSADVEDDALEAEAEQLVADDEVDQGAEQRGRW